MFVNCAISPAGAHYNQQREIDAEETREAMGTTAILAEHDVSPGVKQDFDQPIREAREEFERAYFPIIFCKPAVT